MTQEAHDPTQDVAVQDMGNMETTEQVVEDEERENSDVPKKVDDTHMSGDARDHGVSTIDYLVTLMGYAIGLGNIWRFPYLVGQWGGGSFVLAYLICLILVASPMYLVELHWGQYTRKNTVDCFRVMHPRWMGVAVTSSLMIMFLGTYYNLLLSYSCVYLIGSFYSPLPWSREALPDTPGQSASEYYWQHTVLNRAVTLEGAGDGVEFYIGRFDAEKLYDGKMWSAACGQILFSLSPGMGTAITLSAFSKPTEDVFRINYLVTLCNSAFSLTGGFAVFSILGFMARKSCEPDSDSDCKTVDQLAESGGIGLAFVTLAEGVSQFGNGSNFFAALFFLMLLTLGLDSIFATTETINTYVYDFSKKLRGKPFRKEFIAAGTAIFFFLTGLPFCSRVGIYLLDTVDHFAMGYSLIFVVWIQCMMLWMDWSWELICHGLKSATFGSKEFPEGRNLWIGWRFTMFGTAPLISCGLFWYLFIEDLRNPYEDYPSWLLALGWCVLATALSPTIIFFIIFFNSTPVPLPGKRTKHYNLDLPDEEMVAKTAGSASTAAEVIEPEPAQLTNDPYAEPAVTTENTY
ncbi:putative sodium-dependent transporter [Diplonema papillatum]|nr:putative sodium-dependent transporter [Diplonema papillatum]